MIERTGFDTSILNMYLTQRKACIGKAHPHENKVYYSKKKLFK